VKILRDNGSDEEPNFENILSALAWLSDGAVAGEALYAKIFLCHLLMGGVIN